MGRNEHWISYLDFALHVGVGGHLWESDGHLATILSHVETTLDGDFKSLRLRAGDCDKGPFPRRLEAEVVALRCLRKITVYQKIVSRLLRVKILSIYVALC